MRCRASFSLILVGAWGLSTLSVIADDADRCVNATGRDGIAACDRVIASGNIGGSRLAFAYYNRGLAKLEMGDYDRAIADFDASIRLDPASAATFNNRGSAWYAKGDQDRALADFDKAIQLNPAYAFAYHNRGEVWNDRGDFNRAIADYGKAIDLDRAYTAAYTDRALAYERVGDLTRAKQDFRAALAMPARYSDGQRAQATARERLAALAPPKQRPPTGAIAAAPAAWPGQPGATQSAPPASAPVKPRPSAAPQAVVPTPGMSPVDAGAPTVAQQEKPAALVVNGEAITDDDIDQRTKFRALANNHKSPSRKEVIEELIDDKLKTGIARRYKLDLTDKDVDAQYADMAKRMHTTADELTQLLGANVKTLKAKIVTDLSWQYVIRGRFGPDLAGDKDVNKGDPNVDYIYTLQGVLFQVPSGNSAMLEAHKADAEALRARFTDCDSGLAAARTQHDVVIRTPIIKNSFELVYALREILANTELGHLTPPETTSEGVELFAVCARKENMFRQRSEAFLRELRLHADISDVRDDIRGDISKDRFPAHPPANAQQLDEAAALDKRVGELRQAGKFSEAIPLARHALAICEKECPDQYSVAAEYNILATLYGAQGRYADAEPLYKQALAIWEKALGADRPAVAAPLAGLANLYQAQGRYADAEPLYKRVLAILEKALGSDRPEVAQSLNGLAALYEAQGRYADAEPLYRRALAIYEKAFGADRPEIAAALNSLAALRGAQGRYADAEPLYKRALAIREKALGPDHADVGASLNNLAVLYQGQGRYADAEPLYKRALAILEKALGPDHPNVAQALNGLTELYRLQGRYADAEPLCKQALAILEKALGPDRPEVAGPLANLANLYLAQDRYAEAEPLYKRALAIFEKARGPDHPNVVKTLHNLALLYKAQGRYADAEPLYKRSLAILEKALGPDHPDFAQSLNNLAELYRNQGRYADAEPLYKRALAISEKALGPDHPNVAQWLNNLAVLYGIQGRYADAEPVYKRSLAIREKALGPDHPDVAQTLDNLASFYQLQGRYTDAEPPLRRALAIREKALGPDHPDVAQSLNNLAVLYRNLGRYADAEPVYKRSLAIREKALGPDHPDVATALNELAVLYLVEGRYASAEPLYRRALAIGEKALGPDHPDVAQSLNDLALVYWAQGRYADAEPLQRRALATYQKALGPDHPNVAASLNALANLNQAQGHYADAEPLYRRALAIYEKAFGPDHPNVAASLSALARLYHVQGHYAEVEPLQKRALAIREKALGPDHPVVAASLNDLAALYRNQGRYADAEPLLKRALAIYETALSPDHPDVAQSLGNLAAVYYQQGRYADALPLVQTTIANGRATPSFALPVLLAAQIKGLVPAGKAQDDALDVVQRASRSAAAAAVNKLGARLAAGSGRLAGLVRNDQDLAAEAEALDKAILTAASKEPAKRDAAAEQRIRDRLADVARQRAALQGVFATEFPDYAALSNPQPLTVKDIQALLSDGEALLIYATGDVVSFVFAVTRTSAAWKPIALGTAALSEKVAAFRRGLDVEALRQSAEGGKPVLFDLGLANELHAALVGPVDDLVKNARHLLVVPSGPLTSLPFHLLVTEKPATAIPQLKDIGTYRDAAWLVKRQAVSVLPALASLKALRQVARQEPGVRPLAGFADPVFDPAERAKALAERRTGRTRVAVARGYGEFWQGANIDRAKLARYLPSLLDTADELKAVAAKVGAAPGDIHLGSDASETTVKRTSLADYRVVYFATHGLVAGDVAGLGEPSLALTLPKQPTELDDGLLTASEVAQLKLNADWVVLSACNTAAADKPGAEALSGLARAFFYAGARALLVSHWSVDSEAATRLATSTFAIMKADPKLGRAEALRKSMLTYMNDRKSPLNAYPAFWGPFSIIGEGAAK